MLTRRGHCRQTPVQSLPLWPGAGSPSMRRGHPSRAGCVRRGHYIMPRSLVAATSLTPPSHPPLMSNQDYYNQGHQQQYYPPQGE